MSVDELHHMSISGHAHKVMYMYVNVGARVIGVNSKNNSRLLSGLINWKDWVNVSTSIGDFT